MSFPSPFALLLNLNNTHRVEHGSDHGFNNNKQTNKQASKWRHINTYAHTQRIRSVRPSLTVGQDRPIDPFHCRLHNIRDPAMFIDVTAVMFRPEDLEPIAKMRLLIDTRSQREGERKMLGIYVRMNE